MRCQTTSQRSTRGHSLSSPMRSVFSWAPAPPEGWHRCAELSRGGHSEAAGPQHTAELGQRVERLEAGVGRQNLMRPTDTHNANLLAPACCRLAGSASAAPACVPPESRAPMTDAAASRFGAGRTHQAPASDAVR